MARLELVTKESAVFRSDKDAEEQPVDVESEAWERKVERRASEMDTKQQEKEGRMGVFQGKQIKEGKKRRASRQQHTTFSTNIYYFSFDYMRLYTFLLFSYFDYVRLYKFLLYYHAVEYYCKLFFPVFINKKIN